MSFRTYAPLVFCMLVACSGNPLGNTTDTDTGTDTDTTAVVVPDTLKNNVTTIIYTPAADPANATLQVAISGLDTTPVLATWERNSDLDQDGFLAFSVQEDALDRFFVGLAGESNDGSVRATIAADGGQFNKFFSGTIYERTGEFTAPDATGDGPATGQVSYVGFYAGQLNGGGDGAELLAPPASADPSILPTEAGRVTGSAFINANFADNLVNGSIFNRVVVNAGGFALGDVVLVATDITSNGTFTGTTELINVVDVITGEYGGVFGGTDAGGVAGAISLTDVHDGTGELLDDVLERGVFVLNQCGLTGDVAACAGTAPR
jgi:hypothetical protein